jgi:UPF0042 nucleotide-binding protein
MRLVLISGLSGAGKSTALKALEDMGYFCVDNLPPSLLPVLLELCLHSSRDIRRVGVVIDVRGREFLGDLEWALREVQRKGIEMKLLFLEAQDQVIIDRFKETRRRHPLEEGSTLSEAVKRERELLSFLRDKADEVIDTSRLSGQALRRLIFEKIEEFPPHVTLHLISFGYSFGIPQEADMVFDARFLPNPFYVKELQKLSGLDPQISNWIFQHPEAKTFVQKVMEFLEFLLPLYLKEGRSKITIGIGCTGGKHRSPALAERLGLLLKEKGQDVIITHREIKG